jgi:hypothetical protein
MQLTNNETTKWTVTVSKETDIAVRTFLAGKGMKKGDLSKFIEEAVKWRVLEKTIKEARDQLNDFPAGTLQSLIDEASDAVRNEMFPPKDAVRNEMFPPKEE